MRVTRTSIFSGRVRTLEMDVTKEQFEKWGNGALIQDAFPHLGLSEREFLMTGSWDDEWDEAFGDEEVPEEDKFVDTPDNINRDFADKLYAVDPSVNHAEEHDRDVTQQQLDEEEKNDAASHEIGMRLEDVSQDVQDKMVTTVFRSIMRVADLGETND